MRHRPGNALRLFLLLELVVLSAAGAQVTIRGQVADASTRAPIAGATVRLASGGSVLTDQDGDFRLANVPIGAHALSVTALGYTRSVVSLEVRSDTMVTIWLAVDPVLVDSLLVVSRRVSVRGQLIDWATGKPVMDGAVYATRNRNARSGRDGSFRFANLPGGLPFEISVLAFGYEPVQSSFATERDTTLVFRLREDTLVLRRIAEESQRLHQRMTNATGRAYSIDRAQLQRWDQGPLSETLGFILRAAPYSLSRATACLFVDEQAIGMLALQHLLADEIQRVEYLFDGAMIRVYTRRYMAHLIAEPTTLERPGYAAAAPGLARPNTALAASCR